MDALVEPYRVENARIIRDNNDLHQQLLRLKEENDRVNRGGQSKIHTWLLTLSIKTALITPSSLLPELKAHITKLEHETIELKFLNNQYVHKFRCLEKDSKAKSERIQQLQEKNMQAVVQTPGKSRKQPSLTIHLLMDTSGYWCMMLIKP